MVRSGTTHHRRARTTAQPMSRASAASASARNSETAVCSAHDSETPESTVKSHAICWMTRFAAR